MKNISILAIILFTTLTMHSQTPELMSYQAVVRDADSELLTDQTVGIKISILEDTASGTPVYVETQSPSTNSNGLLSLQVGAGTVVSGDITTIDWANHDYFIKTETDPTGGENYTIDGTSQILSVPYALLSKKAVNVINDLVDDADNDPSNEYNTEIVLDGTNLSIVDGGGTQTADLSSLQGQGVSGISTVNNIALRYVAIENGFGNVEILSTGNLYAGLIWNQSGTTVTVESTAHGLANGDYIVVRGGADDYLYVAISNVQTDEFDYTSATSGAANGTDGAYIPAFDITGFTDGGFTINAPTAGYCQLLSIKTYISSTTSSAFNVVINGDRENGAGENNSLGTRVPPFIRWWDASSATAGESSLSKVTFLTGGDFNVYKISGGTVGDTGGPAICILQF